MRLKNLLLAGAGALLLIAATSLAAGSYLIRPAHRAIGAPSFYTAYESVSFPSTSGSTLKGWYLPGERQAGIVLLHGIRADRSSMIERARFLNRQGYAVLLFDLQGHGESGGDAITFGYLEARDAEAAIRFLREQKRVSWVGGVGTSLGGAAVLLANGAGADAIVVEAVYSTIEEAVDNRFRLRFGSLGKYLSPLLLWQLDWRLGINARDLTPADQIGRIHAPVLIIAGADDQRTTVEDTMLLYERAHDPKTLWLLADAGHQDFYRKAPVEYEKRLTEFFRSAGG